ncbi:MAG: SpoIIE family protein phosphatase [Sediminibacterium sp.]|nr:SpoIIE family protein phosphatase [Sediminibacterium sp.]
MLYVIVIILSSFFIMSLIVAWGQYLKQKLLANNLNLLEKDKNNYESIIEQANDALFVIDIANGSILQCNPSAADMLGYSKAELLTRTLFDIQPAELLNESSARVADVWEKKGLIFTDIPFVTATGDTLPVECSAKVAPFAGRPAIVIYARDIRERLKMENEIKEQSKIIEEKNKDITDSILYAKRIQGSVLQNKDGILNLFTDAFIFFHPRDIVSGDFYWFDRVIANQSGGNPTELLCVAAADCTGHGVPGAFMSIIGSNLLTQTSTHPKVNSPADALNFINAEIKKILNNKASEHEPSLRDGMDVALIAIEKQTKRLHFAGANNPVFIVRNGELTELKADKFPITASTEQQNTSFTDKSFDLQTRDCVYLFTDGYADQFGGDKGKKFMYKRMKELFISIGSLSMKEQHKQIETAFQAWKGHLEQVDDVLVIGIKID